MRTFLPILILLCSGSVLSDDATRNKVAKKLKHKIELKLKKYSNLSGFCDLYIEMKHRKSKAVVVSIKGNGDYQVCKVSKKAIKVGSSYQYQYPEKLIRLHIVP
ncbi:hypothetical protein [Vibrio intestinalis]|uniref:hypothetical protein n=1 Tax=Vibrio intestinalis TaxID=2933291 RepID=UPI0021A73A3E|nr:hypothetical protein [Vibrio intestinalis]